MANLAKQLQFSSSTEPAAPAAEQGRRRAPRRARGQSAPRLIVDRSARSGGPARERAQRADGRDRRGEPRIRIERARLGQDRVAEREVEALPAAVLAGLPVAASLLLEVPGHAGPVVVATSAARAEREREAGLVVLDPAEWGAVVEGAESDRIWPADFRALCDRKAVRPGWVIDPDAALAGARADAPRGWSVEKVLERVGAQLVAVEL